jgi:putative phosphoribosyl transferase
MEREVEIQAGGAPLIGDLAIPDGATGVVAFAHGSGSSRRSPRNREVAEALRRRGLATLLLDLLTAEEEAIDLRTRELRFDIGLLARRMTGTVDWLAAQADTGVGSGAATGTMSVGLFGASTGAAAALVAAAERPDQVAAIVSRGGRPDLAGPALGSVRAPTLLIVGGRDEPVIDMNRSAMKELAGECRLEIVPGATHLFEEPGALEEVSRLAGDWFVNHLGEG